MWQANNPYEDNARNPHWIERRAGFIQAGGSQGFTAGANGNIDGDTACDHWFINDQRNLQNTNNDVSL